MSKFEYGEFVNEPIMPLREQAPLHLHDRTGVGPALTDSPASDSMPDLSYAPGGWTPWMPSWGDRGDNGEDGLIGLPGKTGKAGLKGIPGKDALTPETINDMLLILIKAGKMNLPKGVLRMTPDTLLERWGTTTWSEVIFPTSDPGSDNIWIST